VSSFFENIFSHIIQTNIRPAAVE